MPQGLCYFPRLFRLCILLSFYLASALQYLFVQTQSSVAHKTELLGKSVGQQKNLQLCGFLLVEGK